MDKLSKLLVIGGTGIYWVSHNSICKKRDLELQAYSLIIQKKKISEKVKYIKADISDLKILKKGWGSILITL